MPCTGSEDCRPPDEIDEFLKDKRIQAYYEQLYFDKNGYGEESNIIKKKEVYLVDDAPSDSLWKFKVQKRTVKTSESYFDLFELLTKEHTFYTKDLEKT